MHYNYKINVRPRVDSWCVNNVTQVTVKCGITW